MYNVRGSDNRYHQKDTARPSEDDSAWIYSPHVLVDRYNCDLPLVIDSDGVSAEPLTDEGFGYMWNGCRATWGVNAGRVCYEVKITKNCKVELNKEDMASGTPNVMRVGWSRDNSSLNLGEEPLSFGYGGTAKKVCANTYPSYGVRYTEGDVIGCYVDFSKPRIEISFTHNGNDLGPAFDVGDEELAGAALFPHVFTKNCGFICNFGQMSAPLKPLKPGFTMIGHLNIVQRIRGSTPPEQRRDCEILMMVGLPAAGKSVWAQKYADKHPEKKYNILGTNAIIDKFKMVGLPRNRNYAGRWDMLIDLSTKCLNRLLRMASTTKRNFILDQTNVYSSARSRKMRPFSGFKCKAVVVVPSDNEYRRRIDLQRRVEGKEVPEKAFLEMKANFELPCRGELFDDVIFTELARPEAERLIHEYSTEAQRAGYRSNANRRPPMRTAPQRAMVNEMFRDIRNAKAESHFVKGHRDSAFSESGYSSEVSADNDSRRSHATNRSAHHTPRSNYADSVVSYSGSRSGNFSQPHPAHSPGNFEKKPNLSQSTNDQYTTGIYNIPPPALLPTQVKPEMMSPSASSYAGSGSMRIEADFYRSSREHFSRDNNAKWGSPHSAYTRGVERDRSPHRYSSRTSGHSSHYDHRSGSYEREKYRHEHESSHRSYTGGKSDCEFGRLHPNGRNGTEGRP